MCRARDGWGRKMEHRAEAGAHSSQVGMPHSQAQQGTAGQRCHSRGSRGPFTVKHVRLMHCGLALYVWLRKVSTSAACYPLNQHIGVGSF